MNKFICAVGMAAFVFSGLCADIRPAFAGSKELTAQKREKYEDNSVESMKDVIVKQEEGKKEYTETMMANSNQTVRLLEEIRDLLKLLNEKEGD